MTILTIGKRFLPTEHIALVEPFDPASNTDFKPEKDFKSRLVLVNRDTVLTEMMPEQFVQEHDFLHLVKDGVAVSPRVFFWVEAFEPSDKFQPQKPYQSRLKWRDPEGNERSRLLLTEGRTVAILVVGNSRPSEDPATQTPRRPKRSRRKSSDIEASTNS